MDVKLIWKPSIKKNLNNYSLPGLLSSSLSSTQRLPLVPRSNSPGDRLQTDGQESCQKRPPVRNPLTTLSGKTTCLPACKRNIHWATYPILISLYIRMLQGWIKTNWKLQLAERLLRVHEISVRIPVAKDLIRWNMLRHFHCQTSVNRCEGHGSSEMTLETVPH